MRHPNVFAALLKGKFAVKKTSHALPDIAMDQAPEQNNASRRGMLALLV